MLVRTWNVFHGNASPPERHAFLEEMIRLAVRDRPHIVCLQELPLWSLSHLAAWSGMQMASAVTRRAPLGVEVGRVITDLNHGLLRSAFTGQANAILFSSDFRIRERRMTVLRRKREPRVCLAARVERGGATLVIGNIHSTGYGAEDEIVRAASFVEAFATSAEPISLAGDFNVASEALRTLADRQITGATRTGIDHVLARGLDGPPGEPWPVPRRTVAGRVLSDHPPVDRELT